MIWSCGMSRFALDDRQSGRRTAFGDGGSLSASRAKRSNSVRIPVPEKYTAWISSPNQMKSLSLFASTKSMRPAGLPVDGECIIGGKAGGLSGSLQDGGEGRGQGGGAGNQHLLVSSGSGCTLTYPRSPVEKLPGIPVSDADWQQTPKSVQLLVMALLEVQQRVKQLERQVAELQRGGRRRRGSPPSPPSGQSEEASASTSSRRKRPSGRSPGAQPGHEGHGRTLLSVEQVDTLVPVKPTSCRQCGHALSGDDPHAQRRQVFEIPSVRPQVTEYQVHTLRCPGCDVLTEADWPESVPRSSFGPSVQAWIGLLSGAYRMSKRNIVALLADAFSLDLAVGSVSQLEQHVSEALSAPVEEARDYVRQQAAVHIDETGWREARENAWLWTVATDLVTVFAIRSRRDSEVARELLGDDTTAMVGSDRHTAYSYLPVLQRQACWSHLERTFEKFVDRGGDAAWVGQLLLEFTHQIFTW